MRRENKPLDCALHSRVSALASHQLVPLPRQPQHMVGAYIAEWNMNVLTVKIIFFIVPNFGELIKELPGGIQHCRLEGNIFNQKVNIQDKYKAFIL